MMLITYVKRCRSPGCGYQRSWAVSRNRKMQLQELGRGFHQQSACYASMRVWVQIPSTHTERLAPVGEGPKGIETGGSPGYSG